MTIKPRRLDGLTTLDEFLAEEGKREEFQAIAVEEVRVSQTENAMKKKLPK